MPEFVCRIGAPDGSVFEQQRVAASADALRRELEGEGFHVFTLNRARTRIRIPFLGRSESISGEEFLLFNTQLRTLLRAGLPLTQSLDLLRQQQANPHFRALLDKVHQQVTTGIALSDAFLSLGDTFPRLYANSLRAGERSGELEDVLARFVEYQRLVESVRKRIITALTYPAVLVTLSVALVVVLTTYVIPEFRDFYVHFASELPLPTAIVLNGSAFVRNNLLYLVAGTVIGVWLLRTWARTPRGRLTVDRVRLRVPLMGRLSHLFAMSQFTRSLAVLLGGGTPMVPALETASTSISNTYLSEVFLGCVVEVQEGRPLSDSLEETGWTPELAVAMMRVGESTGALAEMLNHTAEFFEDDIDHVLNRLVTIFEPAVLVFMGLVVAGLLLAVYYPLLTLVNRIG